MPHQLIDLRGNFYRVSNNIYKHNLDIYELGVYHYICRCASNSDKKAFPSLNKIAESINISRAKTATTINNLVEKTVINRISGHDGRSNTYQLLPLSSTYHDPVHEIDGGSPQNGRGVVHEVDSIYTNLNKLNKKTNISDKSEALNGVKKKSKRKGDDLIYDRLMGDKEKMDDIDKLAFWSINHLKTIGKFFDDNPSGQKKYFAQRAICVRERAVAAKLMSEFSREQIREVLGYVEADEFWSTAYTGLEKFRNLRVQLDQEN